MNSLPKVPSRAAALGVAALVAAVPLSGCGSSSSSDSTSTAAATGASTSASTTATTKAAPKPVKGCVPNERPGPRNASAFSSTSSGTFTVQVPKRGLDVKVTDPSASSDASITTAGKKKLTITPKGGDFLFVTYSLENNGKQEVRSGQVSARFLVQSGSTFYAPSIGCRAAAAYATTEKKVNAPGQPVAAGKSGTVVAAYVLPKTSGSLTWIGLGTGKKTSLKVK